MTITLFNTGKRIIKYAKNKEAKFRPGTSIDFPDELGEYLHRLYKGELKKPEEFKANFEGQGAAITEEIQEKRKAGRPPKTAE